MRLDFNVLWIDDQPDQLSAQVEAIARQMEGEGFQFNATTCRSLSEVREFISEDVFQDEVDLILVDWDLGQGLKGEDVISEVRSYIPYKDIVFYSSLTTVNDLRQAALGAGADGIFCTSKNAIVDEVGGVFEALIKKVLDLDHTRGIVMGATSDIDYMTIACLTAIDATGSPEDKTALLQKAQELVAKALERVQNAAKELESATSVVAMFEAHALFTANDRLRVLNTALSKEKFEEHDAFRKGLKSYIQNVVPRRNELGHLVLVPAGKPSELLDVAGKAVTLDEMRELRRVLLGFRSDFRKLRDALLKV